MRPLNDLKKRERVVASRLRDDPLNPVVQKYVRRALALYNGLAAITVGAVFVAPWQTYAVSPVYDIVETQISETWLGVGFLVAGVVQVLAHTLPLPWLWRTLIAFAWLYVALMLLLGDYRSLNGLRFLLDAALAMTVAVLEAARALRRLEQP